MSSPTQEPPARAKPRKTPASPRGTALGRTYEGLRDLIFSYEIKPDERLNEGELAKRFGVSRTPVREALNRLVMENLLRFEPALGFYRPKIDADEIVNLYELRVILETEGVRLAVQRASDAEIAALQAEWAALDVSDPTRSQSERIAADERFHERLVGLSHNDKLVEALRRLNAQIHFVRWAPSGQDQDHRESYRKHGELLEVLRERDEAKAIEALRSIIVRRQEELLDILKEGAAKLFISHTGRALAGR
ncbi:GntR family transcriptional regulator [Pseudodonghicola flavimaris]|uniref:GntR family transcriptional regulator n=1 Tax=Pseudodonghicola flavimaris TaxID=3050036 RepID=A0ABT7F321_9RHOB|nr:GntR family transcriptional regulator [Pseudodonghicola flavimaris]MDK3018890.1 GntR family transcriptional regulator [Pseudodonghicola flavimaris]